MAINYTATGGSLDTSVGIGTAGVALSGGGSSDGGSAQSHKVCHDDISSAIVALEGSVGVNGTGVVTTSHEYRIRRHPFKVWNALDAMPPAANYAVFSTVNSIPFLSFASGTTIGTTFIYNLRWGAVVSANGVIVRIKWASATATTGNCNWGAAWERMGALTVASDHFGTQVTQATATNGTVELFTETAITIPYANMASAVAGDAFRLQIQRVTGGSDTMAGAAQLFTVSVENAT
jgi:hypothetical protein